MRLFYFLRKIQTTHLKTERLFSLILLLTVLSCQTRGPKIKDSDIGMFTEKVPDSIDFTFHVKPVLSDRCFKCHGPDKNAIKGGLSLHTAAGAYMALGKAKDRQAVVPFKPEESELVMRIHSTDPITQMPPPESNLSLSDYEKEVLEKWIAQGGNYQEHWAFTPPIQKKAPPINADWGANEIDGFVLEKLKEKGLKPSVAAPKEVLLRRVFLDLTGIPPSPETVASFVSNKDPIAYDRIVDSLLKTNDYAEHMTSEWLAISRYADTHGYQDDFERIMWPWRDWVIHAFKENMPYNTFVTYQLAGDQLPNPTKEQILATGFNRNHKITFEGGVIPEEYRVEYVEDRTNTFGTAFLGMTMECARCHDHKYDPISQKNHFELFSFFNRLEEKGLVSDRNEVPAPTMRITPEDQKGVLAFLSAQEAGEKTPQKEMEIMVMQDMPSPRKTYILNRGAYDQPTTEVFPNTPEKILPFPEDFPKNRLGLSQWLFAEEHPLTARVAVNRIWQRFFGEGLVASSYDFGNQGALPTHPELLDFIALKFKNEGWDLHNVMRFIVQSDTYKQSSAVSGEALQLDPENKWMARAPRLRLSAESIRDQALAISGLLVRKIGGPSVKPYQPEGLWKETTGGGGGSTANYVPDTGASLYRKSMYTFWKRTVPPPSMLTFDASNRDLCSVKSQQTNTPLQALVLLNDPQIIEASRGLAEKASKKESTIEAQLAYMYLAATGHFTNEKVAEQLLALYRDMELQVQQEGVIPEIYLGIGEKEGFFKEKDPSFTALSLTAHTILNLDLTITRS
jgi:hypothetical protein